MMEYLRKNIDLILTIGGICVFFLALLLVSNFINKKSMTVQTAGKPFSERMKTICRHIVMLLLVAIFVGIIEWIYFGFDRLDFNEPIQYGSGDGFVGLVNVKEMVTNGKKYTLGWPFHIDTSEYSAKFDGLARMLIRFCLLFTDNYILIFNIRLFAIPFWNAIICYFVLQNLKVRDWVAVLSSICFGFCPYVQWRLPGHMSLASIECIPIVLLLCIWLNQDERFNKIGRGWFSYPRNWLSILFAWMIANNGMVYYPFFSCFLLLITALCIGLREKTIKKALPSIVMIFEIAGWLAIAFIPTIIGILKGVGNTAAAGAVRTISDSILYGLRFNNLILSPKGWLIPEVRQFITQWYRSLDNEADYAYMGLTATVGFCYLLIFLFQRKDKKELSATDSNMWLFSRHIVCVLLLTMAYGLGSVVAIFVPMMRCYNRISPFIVGICIFTVAFLTEQMMNRYFWKTKRGILLRVTLLLLLGISIFEQQGAYFMFSSNKATARLYDEDKAFFREIENISGQDAMVFQLPYMKSFENGSTNKIPDYSYYRGILCSDTLRWSYGAATGSENDIWYQKTSNLSPQKMVQELKEKGFSGIYLDLNGYRGTQGLYVKETLLNAVCGGFYLSNQDGHTLYIPFDQESYGIEPPPIEHAAHLSINDVIWFSGDAWNASQYVQAGLCENEGAFTWTKGNNFYMSFSITDYDNDTSYTLELDISHTFNSSQKVIAECNGETVYEDTISGGTISTVLKPDNNGYVELTYYLPDAVSPLSVGMSADSRVLGLALLKANLVANPLNESNAGKTI